jgi:hypothetical protein
VKEFFTPYYYLLMKNSGTRYAVLCDVNFFILIIIFSIRFFIQINKISFFVFILGRGVGVNAQNKKLFIKLH